MSHSISHVWPTSRLFLPLKIFLRHLWPRFSFWKHSPGSIECVGKRIVIVRRVEMILERKTRARAVFDQCLSKSSLKTHAFWLYFQGIFHKKKRRKLLRRCEIYSKMFRKVLGRYEADTRNVWKLQGAWKWWKVQKIAKRPPLGRNRQICPRKDTPFQHCWLSVD